MIFNYRWCCGWITLWCSLVLMPQLVFATATELENRQVATTSNNVEKLHFVQRLLTVSAGANEREIRAAHTLTHVGKDPILLTGTSGPLTTAIEINTEPTKKFFVFVKVEKP